MTLRPFTIDTTVTPDQATWAAVHLAELPTVFTFHPERPVEHGTDPADQPCRRAFTIVASPSTRRRFNIHLRAGASSSDLARAHRLILNAKAGQFNPDLWERRESWGDWILRSWWYPREDDTSDELRECHEPGCVTQWHSWAKGEQDELCELEPTTTNAYTVTGFKLPGEDWAASASFFGDPEDGPAGLRAVRDLANDYAWMQTECDRLNAAALAVSGA